MNYEIAMIQHWATNERWYGGGKERVRKHGV